MGLFYVGFCFRVGDVCGVGFRYLWSFFWGWGPRRFWVCRKGDFSGEVRAGVGIGMTGWVCLVRAEARVSVEVINRGPVEGMRGNRTHAGAQKKRQT